VKFYLSARYGRRAELCEYRDQMLAIGHEVTSRWLDDADADDDGVSMPQGPDYRLIAQMDWMDVVRADVFIGFTEPPGNPWSRGGRHVELGLALGGAVDVWVVGYFENVFCYLQGVDVFDTWQQALELAGKL
tara:strand:+ start:202 stop:597 length:396 start_codon:yes stop_codon:yes gene_type:complete